MKPEAENILLIDECEKLYKEKFLPNFKGKKLDDETLRSLLTEELKNDYQVYIDYFEKNSAAHLEKYKKNTVLSNLTRTEGNKIVGNKKHDSDVHEEIWKFYSKSIALASKNSEELAQGYGNRSYILLHLNKFEDAIKDIDRAVAITNSDALKIKLLCRKITCLTELGQNEEKKKTWKLAESVFNGMDESLRNERLDKILKEAEDRLSNNKADIILEKKKISLPLSTDAVNISCNTKCETHLIAARDLQPGEIVMVLKPFVTAANSNKFYAYCSHCLAFTWASIPCDHCSLSMFCSEKCKDDAWQKYHEIECKILPHMQFDLALYYYYQMSIRTVIMAVKEAGNIKNLQEKLKNIENKIPYKKEFNNEDIARNDIIDFYTLPHEYDLRYLVQFIKNSVFLLSLIIQSTELLGKKLESKNGPELADDKDVTYISTLLLKFSMIASSNINHISLGDQGCKKNRSDLDCIGYRCCTRGAYVTPISVMIGSDCNASASKCFTDDGKIIYYCSQPIIKNSQICVNNFNYFYREEKNFRQELMKLKNYVCNCTACEQNWPTMKTLFDRYSSELVNKKTKQATLAPEILPRYQNISQYKSDSYIPDECTFQQISKDVAEAVNTCGQPTFLTCVLIDVLTMMFDNCYSLKLNPVPSTCSKF